MDSLAVGLRLAVFGMGLVFGLLALLWLLLRVLLRLDRAPRPVPTQATVRAPAGPAALDAETLAALLVAVREHRKIRRKQAAPALRMHLPGTLPSRWIVAGRTRQNRSWAPGGRYS